MRPRDSFDGPCAPRRWPGRASSRCAGESSRSRSVARVRPAEPASLGIRDGAPIFHRTVAPDRPTARPKPAGSGIGAPTHAVRRRLLLDQLRLQDEFPKLLQRCIQFRHRPSGRSSNNSHAVGGTHRERPLGTAVIGSRREADVSIATGVNLTPQIGAVRVTAGCRALAASGDAS